MGLDVTNSRHEFESFKGTSSHLESDWLLAVVSQHELSLFNFIDDAVTQFEFVIW
jgi:hypothetical protein